MKKLIIIMELACCSLGVMAQTPLSLSECRQRAVANNEQMVKANNGVDEADLQKKALFTNYLPKVSGSAGVMCMSDTEMESMGMTTKMRGAYLAGLSLTQPIYAGGKITAGYKMAKIGKECAEEQKRKAKMDIIAEADNAYWTYMAVLEKIKMVEAYNAQMDSIYNIVKLSVEAEMGTEYELVRIDAKRSELKYQLQKAKNGANLCRLNLCNVMGDSSQTQYLLTDTVIQLSELTSDADISRRPELFLMEKNIEVKEQQVKLTRGDFLPTVGLSAGYNWYGNIKIESMVQAQDGNYYPYEMEFKDGLGTVAAVASIPIWNWLEGPRKVKKAKLEVEDAQLDYQRNSRLLSMEAQQALQNVTDAYSMIETTELGVKQADENLRIMRDNYENDMGTLTDLLDAQSQWQQARSNLIEAKTQAKIYETEYLRVTGRLE